MGHVSRDDEAKLLKEIVDKRSARLIGPARDLPDRACATA
jgi:hypothetical protein